VFSDPEAIHGVIVPVKTHLAADGYEMAVKQPGSASSSAENSAENRAKLSLMGSGHVVG
jgi:hypothetical protein